MSEKNKNISLNPQEVSGDEELKKAAAGGIFESVADLIEYYLNK